MTLNQTTLRTPETQTAYMKHLDNVHDGSCIYCKAMAENRTVKEFFHWVIIENQFPYDRVFDPHTMLSPRRHVEKFLDLSLAEIYELEKIKKDLDYNQAIENAPADRSIPGHFHFHIVKIKIKESTLYREIRNIADRIEHGSLSGDKAILDELERVVIH